MEQSPQALLGIRLFFGMVAAICVFALLPLLVKYPINCQSHAEIRRKLEATNSVSSLDDMN